MKYCILTLLLIGLMGCAKKDAKPDVSEADQALHQQSKMFFEAIPAAQIDQEANKDLIALGEKLYYEKKLSINGTISCNSCHMLNQFGVDNEPTSPGHDGTRGGRNSPTVYNASLQFAQFWDGRAPDVEEQALGPILNPIEHGLKDADQAMAQLDSPMYRTLFQKAFPDEADAFTYQNIGRGIGAFERTLLTPSRFDTYLQGDVASLNDVERAGLAKFVETGCTACHSGVTLGGNMFQKMGLFQPYETKDLGRYDVTKNEAEKYFFKVPQLRNITKTGPYLHDGSVESLEEAIQIMGRYQLGVELNSEDVASIVAFLGTLEGNSPHLQS